MSMFRHEDNPAKRYAHSAIGGGVTGGTLGALSLALQHPDILRKLNLNRGRAAAAAGITGALGGAALGGGGLALGDLLTGGQAKTRAAEVGHGALGGAALGAGAGFVGMGKMPHGAALVHFLMQHHGVPKNKALAMVMGGASAIGAGVGAYHGMAGARAGSAARGEF